MGPGSKNSDVKTGGDLEPLITFIDIVVGRVVRTRNESFMRLCQGSLGILKRMIQRVLRTF